MTTPAQKVPLLSLLLASSVSYLGDAMTNLALPWFVLETTGSVAQTGVAALFQSLGSYLSSFFTGPLIDRFPGKVISIASDVGAGIGIALVPILYHAVGLEFWQLLAIVFLVAIVGRPGALARRRVLPEIAAHAGVGLERVNGANEISYQTTLLLGPPLAGLLISWIGASNVLFVDAATFLVSMLLVGTLIPTSLMAAGQPGAGWSFRARMREGLDFLRRDDVLIPLELAGAIGILLVNVPLFALILPAYARQRFGDAVELGLLISVFAVGALIGASLYSMVGPHLPRRRMWIICYLLTALPFWAMATDAPVLLLGAAMFLYGAAEGFSTPLASTIRYERVPLDLRGRVFGMLTPLTGLSGPLGRLFPTVIIAGIGLTPTIAVLAMLTTLGALSLFTIPAFHRLDRPAQAVPASSNRD
jgi:MFS family permease